MTGRTILTRKRLLMAVLVVVGMIAAGWFGGRYRLARWSVQRALAAAGLEPATFQVQSVGLGTLRVTNLSVGSAPWLTASSLEMTFSLGGLLAARVGTIRLAGVQWTVQARDGVIDWGYVPAKSTGAAALDLPCDFIEVAGSVIRVVVDGGPHDIQLEGRLARTDPGRIAGQFELAALARKATITAQVKADDQQLTVELDGNTEHLGATGGDGADATIPAGPSASAASSTPQARWHAVLLRKQPGGATRVDFDLTLVSIAERAGSVEIALAGASVTAHAVLGESGMTSSAASISAQGLRVGGVTLQTAQLNATKKVGSELELDVKAAGEGWKLPGARGSVLWGTTAGNTKESPKSMIFTAAMRTEEPLLLNLESAGIIGLVESVTAAARLQVDESGVHVLDGRVTLDGASLQAGDLALSDGHAEVVMRDPETIEVTSLAAIVGDGSTISAEPFTWNPREPRVQARLTINNLSLAQWLPIITSNHATGEGRVSGHADVAIDWSTGAAKLHQLQGSLRADPEHGFIQATDADALGGLLEKQDPRFATDEVMRPVRDKIIAALRDFEFTKLTVDLSRPGDHTVALTYLSGFGRHGDDPQGLNLTLDLHVEDSFVDLASRIASKSRVKEAARSALEEFFQEAPAGQEER